MLSLRLATDFIQKEAVQVHDFICVILVLRLAEQLIEIAALFEVWSYSEH